MPDVTRDVTIRVNVQGPTGVRGVGGVGSMGGATGAVGGGGVGAGSPVTPNYGTMGSSSPWSGHGGRTVGGIGRYIGDLPYNPWSGVAARMPGGVGSYRGDMPYNPWSGVPSRMPAGVPGAAGRYRGDMPPGSPWSGMPSRMPMGFGLGRIRGDLEAAEQATERWAEKMGRVAFETARVATWSRLVTRTTFAAEAFRGGRLAAGYGGVGALGAAGIIGLAELGTGFAGTRALMTPQGRGGFLDFWPRAARTLWYGQPQTGVGMFERRAIERGNVQAEQQRDLIERQREAFRGAWGQYYGLQNQGMIASLTQRQALAGAGVLPLGAERERVYGEWMASQRNVSRLYGQLAQYPTTPGVTGRGIRLTDTGQRATPPHAWWNRNPFYYGPAVPGQENAAGYGGMMGPPGMGRVVAQTTPWWNTQAAQQGAPGPGGQQTREFFERTRVELENAVKSSEKLGRQWVELGQMMVQEERRRGEEQIRISERLHEESLKFLSSLQESRLTAVYGMAAFSPGEVRSATRKIERIQKGGRLPRGAAIDPALGFLLGHLPPEEAQRIGELYAKQPDIAAALRATHWPGEIATAQEQARKFADQLNQFQTQFDERVTGLSKAIIEGLKKVEADVTAWNNTQLDRAKGVAVSHVGKAAPVAGQGE